MRKRLVICCDGTWNRHDDPFPTNVYKLRNLLLPDAPGGMPQAVYYDSGVGTTGNWFRRAWNGATGRGLSANVLQAYGAVIDNYERGDEIFLFGFSRGAFTVRSLAGLIRNCGILRKECRDRIDAAYSFYRSRSPSKAPRERQAAEFRANHAVEDVTPIRFIGVWDTVGSLGNPLMRHNHPLGHEQFHDVKLSSIVEHAYQALAIDEHRLHFTPAVWRQQTHATSQRMQQAWFIGAHSDVGGGYPQPELSHIALNWILGKAVDVGLAVDPERARRTLGERPEWMPIGHGSHQGFYRLFPALDRTIGRPPVDDGERLPTNEVLHWTVVARYKQDLGYRPVSLADYVARNKGVLEGKPESNPLLARP